MEAAPNSADDGAELVLGPTSAFSLDELRALWEYRELLWILGLRDVSVRYKQALLGVTWALLQPAAQAILFTVLFHRLAGIQSGGPVPYPLFCLSGLVIWHLFAHGLSHASESLVGGGQLISKVYFPRALLPAAAIFTAVVDFAVAAVMLLGVMLWYGVWPGWSSLAALPIAALAAATALALGLWTSAINLQFRDVRHALPFVLQLLVYLTPVFYPTALVPEKWRWATALNPMWAVVESFRAALFGQPLPIAHLAIAAAVTLVVGVSGFAFFRSLERGFADRV
jgi:lipopolysaccharide transport system permease protein